MNARNTTSAVSVALTLLLAAGALTCLGLMVGDGTLQWPWGLTSDPITAEIIWQIRAPRSIGAWAAGALLGLAGAIAQAIFRNPLADPYLLGSSSGAALAVAIALALASWLGADVSGAAFWGGFMAFGLTGAAFTGALLAVILTVTLAGGVAQGTRLLLGGVVVGVVLGALTSFLTFIAPNVLLNMQGFMLGSTALLNWSAVGRLLVVGAICMAIAATFAKPLDALQLGERTARSLGIPLSQVNAIYILLLATVTGAAVAHTGLIAFVGLAAPHVVRALLPCQHRALLLLSSLTGGLLLLGADALARLIFSPMELPTGLLTALLGGGYLLWRMGKVGRLS